MKRIITCSDGTWNKPDEKVDGVPTPTNVCIFHNLIANHDNQNIVQKPFYDSGVGTGDWFDKITGGLIGAGIDQNIKDAYKFIVDNYEPNDEIYLLGFSRGAYTARSVAGFIYNCGILKFPTDKLIDEAFDLYRRRDDNSHPWAEESINFRNKNCYPPGKIKFVGVWDTVGALGIPSKLFDEINKEVLHCEFHDVQLSSMIEYAFHAVAIDEHRLPFEPTLWSQTDSGIAAGQKMEQKWFPGVHSDVGGSYKEHGLSDAPLIWMIEHAKALGLAFNDYSSIVPNPFDKMHNSMTAVYRLKGILNRKIGNGQRFNESISHPTVDRWNANTDNYKQKANPYLKLYLKK
jgi:uncharacterized protein (DUF2235 family)